MKFKSSQKVEILNCVKNFDVSKLTKIINGLQKRSDSQSCQNHHLQSEVDFCDENRIPLIHHTIVGPDDVSPEKFERSFECFKILLCCNADIRSINGRTEQNSLHVASLKGNRPIVELLLSQKESPVNSKDINGNSALHIAAERNHLEVVQMLLKHGADINSKNYSNQTALDMAASHDANEVIAFLLPKMQDLIKYKKHSLQPTSRNHRNNFHYSTSSFAIANNPRSNNYSSKMSEKIDPCLEYQPRPTSFSQFFEKNRHYSRSSSVAPTFRTNTDVMTSSFDSTGFQKNCKNPEESESISLEDLTICPSHILSNKKQTVYNYKMDKKKTPNVTSPQMLHNQWNPTQSCSSVNLNQPMSSRQSATNIHNLPQYVPNQPLQGQRFSPSGHFAMQNGRHVTKPPYMMQPLGQVQSQSKANSSFCSKEDVKNLYKNPQPTQTFAQGQNYQNHQSFHRTKLDEDSFISNNKSQQPDVILQRSKSNSISSQHHQIVPNDQNNQIYQHIEPEQGKTSKDQNDVISRKLVQNLQGQMKQMNLTVASNRNSAASLDSGRGSECTSSEAARNASINNCSSNQSDILNASTSSSSSSCSAHSPSKGINNTDLIGLPQPMGKLTDSLSCWMANLGLEKYLTSIAKAGYDLPTLTKATSDDLITVGVTNPRDRQFLRMELAKLTIQALPSTFTSKMPKDLYGWLYSLDLHQAYWNIFQTNQIHNLQQLSQLNWEDLQDLGPSKLGQQKKLILAIDYMNKALKAGTFSLNEEPVTGETEHGELSVAVNDEAWGQCNSTSLPYPYSPSSAKGTPQIRDNLINPTNQSSQSKCQVAKNRFQASQLPPPPPAEFQDSNGADSTHRSAEDDKWKANRMTESQDRINLQSFSVQETSILNSSLLPLPKNDSAFMTNEIQGDMEDVLRVLRETIPSENQ